VKEDSVLHFLEHTKSVYDFPFKISVERTSQSKYQFYLLVRQYRKRVKLTPKFFTYNKGEAPAVKGLIEEHSVFEETALFVLEGFSARFVDNLEPPTGTYIVAETDAGMLKAESFSYKNRRALLRVLYNTLTINSMTFGELKGLDWSTFRGIEEFEPFLRKIKIMEWNKEETTKRLETLERGNLLGSVKRSNFEVAMILIGRYGPIWTQRYFMGEVILLLKYRALRVMGYDDLRIKKELDISAKKLEELEESARMITVEDQEKMADRLFKLDQLILRNPNLGMELFFLNAPIQIKM